MLFINKESKIYALKKDKFISVSIVMPNKKTSHHKSSKSAVVIPQSIKKISKEKDIDVNELFSDVWTPNISQKKQKINSKRVEHITQKLQTAKKNKVESLTKKIEESQIDKSEQKSENQSMANEVNEYLAKIQAIVYQHFNVPANSEGNSVKTVIELDPLGRMKDFRILSYSANAALNEEADKIKERLKNVVFPVNPQHKSSRTIVVLISKE